MFDDGATTKLIGFSHFFPIYRRKESIRKFGTVALGWVEFGFVYFHWGEKYNKYNGFVVLAYYLSLK